MGGAEAGGVRGEVTEDEGADAEVAGDLVRGFGGVLGENKGGEDEGLVGDEAEEHLGRFGSEGEFVDGGVDGGAVAEESGVEDGEDVLLGGGFDDLLNCRGGSVAAEGEFFEGGF